MRLHWSGERWGPTQVWLVSLLNGENLTQTPREEQQCREKKWPGTDPPPWHPPTSKWTSPTDTSCWIYSLLNSEAIHLHCVSRSARDTLLLQPQTGAQPTGRGVRPPQRCPAPAPPSQPITPASALQRFNLYLWYPSQCMSFSISFLPVHGLCRGHFLALLFQWCWHN